MPVLAPRGCCCHLTGCGCGRARAGRRVREPGQGGDGQIDEAAWQTLAGEEAVGDDGQRLAHLPRGLQDQHPRWQGGKAALVLAFTVVALLPTTRLIHVISVPVNTSKTLDIDNKVIVSRGRTLDVVPGNTIACKTL